VRSSTGSCAALHSCREVHGSEAVSRVQEIVGLTGPYTVGGCSKCPPRRIWQRVSRDQNSSNAVALQRRPSAKRRHTDRPLEHGFRAEPAPEHGVYAFQFVSDATSEFSLRWCVARLKLRLVEVPVLLGLQALLLSESDADTSQCRSVASPPVRRNVPPPASSNLRDPRLGFGDSRARGRAQSARAGRRRR